jgi:Bacillus/Clostridium GerA spore germination protein.
MDYCGKRLTTDLKENVGWLKEILAADRNFDVIHMELVYGGREAALFFIDGFLKDDLFLQIMLKLSTLKPEDLGDRPLNKLLRTHIPYVELESSGELSKLVDGVLSGQAILLFEGLDEAVMIDARTYPARNPEEPGNERVVRGSRDGFVETLVFNTTLTRRRIRDRSLRMEFLQIGRRSKTDVVICYLEDIANEELVGRIRNSLENIDADGLPMAEKTIEEYLSGQHWNPYPTVRYTERPDTVAAHLLEGHVAIVVDGSPSVILAPATFWHHLQHAEEYRNKPVVGAYLRLVRYLAVLLSIFLLPIWYLFAIKPGFVPDWLPFMAPDDGGSLPLFLQLFFIEIGIDMLRMAAIHTPTSLATAMGLVATIMIGQLAVEVGLLSNEVILYMSIAAVGSFATPSYELSLANRIFRLLLLVATALFNVHGFIIGSFLWFLLLTTMKSYNVPYLWPFIPFHFRAFQEILIRTPMPLKSVRPEFLSPKDPDR